MKQHTPESLILRSCLQWLCVHGCDVVRCNTGGATKKYTSKKTGLTSSHHIRFGKRGMGDIIAISPYGRWLEVECKSETGKQSPEQIMRQQNVEIHNGLYILARSVDDLEAQKEAILTAYYPPAFASGVNNDYRIRPTSRRKQAHEVLP